MAKKILALALSVFVISAFFIGCSNKNNTEDKVSSYIAEIESEAIADVETSSEEESSKENETSSKPETSSKEQSSSKNETSSKENSSKIEVSRPTQTSSKTESDDIKKYKNPANLGMMSYHLNMNWCSGVDKEEEFRAIVNEKYFNQYILDAHPNILTEAKIIGEAGGSFWIQISKSKKVSDKLYWDDLDFYIQTINRMGYGDLLNGFHWDEPLWGGKISNKEFLEVTEYLYKKYGKRNFPVFATGEFSGFEGNQNDLNIPAESMGKVTTPAIRYCSDVGFDSYSVDVRDGAPNANKYAQWQDAIDDPLIVDGKSYYTRHKEFLKKHSGHDVNVWYFPCCYYNYLWGGLNGVMYADEEEKWENYSERLRYWCHVYSETPLKAVKVK